GPLPVVAKAVVLLAAIVWIASRPEPSQAESYVLFAVIPAVSTASSAWIAGPRADAPFYVSMIAVGAIVAAVFDRGVVTASGASELAGFAVVQFHREPAGHALVM